MRRSVSSVLVVPCLLATVVAVALAGPPDAASAEPTTAVVYRPPVDAPVVDHFRPPSRPGGRRPAGPTNVGIDYATEAGTPVRAAAAGTVAFAGQVGGRLHVVLLHADGIRTTYAFLASVAVARGQAVPAGGVVGTAGASVHFGARAAGDAYLDPLVLLAGGGLDLRLVADGPQPEAEPSERDRLVRFLRGVPRAALAVGVTALDWAGDAAGALNPVPSVGELAALRSSLVSVPLELATAAGRWREQRASCTPPGVSPPRPAGRRLAVLVSGLASSSRGAAVFGVRTRELGYADADVHRFSYRAATTAERSFGKGETQVDLAESGRRMRALLEDLAERHPGVPVDVIAHSQGGLVARAALGGSAPPSVATLVTLGTPHRGADLATLGAVLRGSVIGSVVANVADQAGPVLGVELSSPSVAQLAEGSAFLRQLDRQPLPPGLRVTSVAARTDWVVTSPKARLGGAANVVVSVPAGMAHDALPGSDQATREIALAVAGAPPTCRGFLDAVADEAVGAAITGGFDIATAAVLVPATGWLR